MSSIKWERFFDMRIALKTAQTRRALVHAEIDGARYRVYPGGRIELRPSPPRAARAAAEGERGGQ